MPAKQILFGQHVDWLPLIAPRIDRERFAASFAPLNRVDLDGFDAVVPLQLRDYPVLARRSDLRGRRFLHPEDATVVLCDDKLALAEFLIARGFGGNVPAIRRAEEHPYPVVRRPRRADFGRGARIIRHAQDDTPVAQDDDCFDQAYIPGADEFVLHAIRHAGEIRFAWALHHRMAGPHLIRGGANAPVETREADALPALKAFAPMLAALDYEGTCSIDYKVVDGTPYLLEINPRFGASLAFGINAYVEAYLRCLASEDGST